MIYSLAKRSTMKDLLAFVFSVACCIVFVVNFEVIDSYGFERRCRALLPQCQELHQRLSEDWPKSDGELPYAGSFFAYEDHPDLLLLPTKRPSTFAETLGNSIERSDAGAMRFQVCGIRQACIEFHPESQSPHTFRNCRGVQMTPREHKQLEGEWYLCLYHEQLPK